MNQELYGLNAEHVIFSEDLEGFLAIRQSVLVLKAGKLLLQVRTLGSCTLISCTRVGTERDGPRSVLPEARVICFGRCRSGRCGWRTC